MLPGLDGFELCRRIQQESIVYVLMLTARAEEVDKIVGLSVGADDYLTKPSSPRDLIARVKAILRRHRKEDERAQPPGRAGSSPLRKSRSTPKRVKCAATTSPSI